MTSISFYQALAHLFYAAAFADKNFAELEKVCINNIVIKDWNYMIGDLDSKEIIYQTLRELIKENTNYDDAFAHFQNYFLMNRAIFSKEIKAQVMRETEQITISFSRRNKSELIFLTHLYRLLWKGEPSR